MKHPCPRNRHPRARLLLTVLLACSLPPVFAAELLDAAANTEAVRAPQFLADPALPPGAPTPAALQSVGREDGPAAGVTLAAQALRASRLAYGAKDVRTVVALTNQATAKQRAGNAGGALGDYQAAVALAESAGGPRDPHLFDAWYGIGYIQHLAGNEPAAAAAFATALQLHRINQGLYSREQLDVLHALAVTTYASGRSDNADAYERRRLDVAKRLPATAGTAGSLALGETLSSVGRWFRNAGRIDEALNLQSSGLDVLGRALGKDNPELIDHLLEMATTAGMKRPDFDEGPLPPSRQPANLLGRAERLADARKGVTPDEQALTLTRIADVYLLQGRTEPALRLYARVTQMQAGAGRASAFADPAFLLFRPPASPRVSGPAGFVLAEFDVDDDGRARNVRIVESQPADLPKSVASDLVSAIRAARLRPVIRSGKLVESTGARYRLLVRSDSA
ncbi:MAG: energy transducer TonB [Panacagrimonas sp.]